MQWYPFPVREESDGSVRFGFLELPTDLTRDEADRLEVFIRSLAVADEAVHVRRTHEDGS